MFTDLNLIQNQQPSQSRPQTEMGNVHASEAGIPPPSGGSQSGPPSGSPQQNDNKNPGTVEDLHKDCKEVFPIPFEGSKLLIQKALSSTFQVRFHH